VYISDDNAAVNILALEFLMIMRIDDEALLRSVFI